MVIDNNPYLDQVCAIATAEGSLVVAVCAAVELGIAELDEEKSAMNELGLERLA